MNHLPLTGISIFNKEFIEFKNCNLKSIKENKNRIVWYSEEFNSNNCQISISLNMSKFKEIINKNLINVFYQNATSNPLLVKKVACKKLLVKK